MLAAICRPSSAREKHVTNDYITNVFNINVYTTDVYMINVYTINGRGEKIVSQRVDRALVWLPEGCGFDPPRLLLRLAKGLLRCP